MMPPGGDPRDSVRATSGMRAPRRHTIVARSLMGAAACLAGGAAKAGRARVDGRPLSRRRFVDGRASPVTIFMPR